MSRWYRFLSDLGEVVRIVEDLARHMREIIEASVDKHKKPGYTPLSQPGTGERARSIDFSSGDRAPVVRTNAVAFFQKHGYWPDSEEDLDEWRGGDFDGR